MRGIAGGSTRSSAQHSTVDDSCQPLLFWADAGSDCNMQAPSVQQLHHNRHSLLHVADRAAAAHLESERGPVAVLGLPYHPLTPLAVVLWKYTGSEPIEQRLRIQIAQLQFRGLHCG
eukprot:1144491-Pelagomonas_calceolata.AAC.4